VRWIGGGSGSGKSTVARRVAERCGLRVYSTDEAMAGHVERARLEDAPLLAAFLAMDLDEGGWTGRRRTCSRRSTGSTARAST